MLVADEDDKDDDDHHHHNILYYMLAVFTPALCECACVCKGSIRVYRSNIYTLRVTSLRDIPCRFRCQTQTGLCEKHIQRQKERTTEFVCLCVRKHQRRHGHCMTVSSRLHALHSVPFRPSVQPVVVLTLELFYAIT